MDNRAVQAQAGFVALARPVFPCDRFFRRLEPQALSSYFLYEILTQESIESFDNPEPLKSIFPVVLVKSWTEIFILAAGDARIPEIEIGKLVPATVAVIVLAITVVPSHNLTVIADAPPLSDKRI